MAGSSEVVTHHDFIEYCNVIATIHVRSPYVLESVTHDFKISVTQNMYC